MRARAHKERISVQRGQIFKRHGAWHLRYRVNGEQVCQKLADYSDEYRTITSVRQLADDILLPINRKQPTTTTSGTLKEFVEGVYLPYARQHKKPSTADGYEKIYNKHVAHRADTRVRAYRTCDVQQLLTAIAAENDLTHRTLTNIRNFLKGVFSHAKRMGSFDGVNPVQDTEIPKGRASSETHAYSAAEVKSMRKALKGDVWATARVAITVAAYTGLSLGELQGLKWEDITDHQLTVNRTIWNSIEGTPKTEARKNAVPLLPIVQKELAEHHRQNPLTVWVFEDPRTRRPRDLVALGRKKIKPQLAASGVKWYGWHAFRRGFATRLHEEGVQDKIIQSLMRHSSLSVTMGYYVKALPAANIKAIQKLK